MDTKLCNDCGQDKTLDQFYTIRKGCSDLRSKCKTCCCKAERERDVKSYNYTVTEKFCIGCGTTKPSGNFRKNGHSEDGLNYYCIVCGQLRQEALKSGEAYDETYVPEEKFCTQCKYLRPCSDYGGQPRAPFGLKSICKICHNQNRRQKESQRAESRKQSGWARPVVGDKWCFDCKQTLPVVEFSQDIKTLDGLQRRCNVCNNKQRKEARINLRLEVLAYYSKGSFQCACPRCGERIIEFLCIDHINGGGHEHRKEIGFGSEALYKWLKKNNFPPGFQVLCANCNGAKHWQGICPHQKEKECPKAGS